jgi:hypothetical protein
MSFFCFMGARPQSRWQHLVDECSGDDHRHNGCCATNARYNHASFAVAGGASQIQKNVIVVV